MPSTGGDVTLTVYNGGDALKVSWNGAEMKDAKLEKGAGGGLRVTLPVPAGVGSRGHKLKLHNAASGFTTTIPTAYAPPSILRASSLKTEGGDILILGANFGSDASAIRVSVDGQACEAVELKAAHSKIHAHAPPGVGISTLRVQVADQSCDADALHAAPEVLVVEPPDVDLSGGVIELVGKSFGTDASRIQVLLPDVAAEATNIVVVEPHTRIQCTLPAIPGGVQAGEEVRLRVLVAGVHSLTPATVVYCPPQGVPATTSRPAYVPKRSNAKVQAAAAAAPYADLFATALPVERRKGTAGAGAPAVSSPVAKGSPAQKGGKAAASPAVRVGGTLSGNGPTLSIASPSKWVNTENCEVCRKEFGLSLRRHHCRICGACVCNDCSPHTLQLSPARPPVRVCSRCHLRVGLLNQMTTVIDTIYTIRKVLPASMYDTFKAEIIEAVTADTTGSGAAAAAAALSSPKTPRS